MSKIAKVQSADAPVAVGPYSQAIACNNFIFCSGQIGIDPKNNILVDGIDKQTHQVMQNLKEVLAEAHSDLDFVLKTTIYLSDMKNYVKVNEIYGSYFINHKPARATIEVSCLPKNALVEIDAIAIQK